MAMATVEEVAGTAALSMIEQAMRLLNSAVFIAKPHVPVLSDPRGVGKVEFLHGLALAARNGIMEQLRSAGFVQVQQQPEPAKAEG